MLTIRLQRVGKKHQPSYRIVLIDSRRAAKSGSVLEILGSYNPKKKESSLKIEEIKKYLCKGARLSDTVRNLLTKNKIKL